MSKQNNFENLIIFDFNKLKLNDSVNKKEIIFIDFIEILYQNLNIYYPLPYLKYTKFINQYAKEILSKLDKTLFKIPSRADFIIKIIIFLKIKIILKYNEVLKNIDLLNLDNLLESNKNYCLDSNNISSIDSKNKNNLNLDLEIDYWSKFYSEKLNLQPEFKLFLTQIKRKINIDKNFDNYLSNIFENLFKKELSTNYNFLFLIIYQNYSYRYDLEYFIKSILCKSKKKLEKYKYIFQYKSFLILKPNNKYRILNISYDVGHFLNYILLSLTEIYNKQIFNRDYIQNLYLNFSNYKEDLKKYYNKNIYKIDLKKAFDNLPFEITKYYTSSIFHDYLDEMIYTPITCLNFKNINICKNKGIAIGNILSFKLYDFYLYNYLIYLFKKLIQDKKIIIYYYVDDIRIIDLENTFSLKKIINIFNENNLFINKYKTELLNENKFYLCVGKLEIKFSDLTINTNTNMIFNKKLLDLIKLIEEDNNYYDIINSLENNLISFLPSIYKNILILYYIFSNFKSFNYEKFIFNIKFLPAYKKIINSYFDSLIFNSIDSRIIKIYEEYIKYLDDKFNIYIVNKKIVIINKNIKNIHNIITKNLNNKIYNNLEICGLINDCGLCRNLK